MSRPWQAASLCLLLLGAGCLGLSQDPAPAPSPAAEPQTGAGGARLLVEVLDPARTPIPEADVTLTAAGSRRTVATDGTGAAVFEAVEPGTALLDVRAEGFQGQRLETSLPAGGQAERTVVLVPETEASTTVLRYAFEGFFECSATYLIITGDCLAPVGAALEPTGIDPERNATNARYVFPFPLHEGWTELSIVQTWQEPVAGAGSMMRLNLEPIDPTTDEGHGQRYARADGASALELTVTNDGEPEPSASDEALVLPEQGGTVQTRTFHLGLADTHRPAGTGFLGVGASIQQHFTVYVNVTYAP